MVAGFERDERSAASRAITRLQECSSFSVSATDRPVMSSRDNASIVCKQNAADHRVRLYCAMTSQCKSRCTV
jgi:hypothetical protein